MMPEKTERPVNTDQTATSRSAAEKDRISEKTPSGISSFPLRKHHNLSQNQAIISNSPRLTVQRQSQKTITSHQENSRSTNGIIQRKPVIQLVGDDDKKKAEAEKRNLDILTIGTRGASSGVPLSSAEKVVTGGLEAAQPSLQTHPGAIIEHANQAASGGTILADAGGVLAGGMQIYSTIKADHLSTGERVKDVSAATVSTGATLAKTGLDVAQVVTHASALAPPAAFLGAATGGVEAIKGGVDAYNATHLRGALSETSDPTRALLGPQNLSLLEVGAYERQKDAGISALLGGGKVVGGVLVAAIGLAHLGPVGLAVGAALLGTLGVIGISRFAHLRYKQRDLGMQLVQAKKAELAQKHVIWSDQLNAIEQLLHGKGRELNAQRGEFEKASRELDFHRKLTAKETTDDELVELARLNQRKTALQEHIDQLTNHWENLYERRWEIIREEPKIAARYDEKRIEGHWRGYGDVFREELAEKAMQAATVIHTRLLQLWQYQAQAGEGEVRGQIDMEFLEIVKHLGVKYDPANQKPSAADLQKAINRNLQTMTNAVN